VSNKKRIAIVLRTMGLGGAEVVTLNLGSYFLENEFDVEIITTGDPGIWFKRIGEMGMKGIHVHGRYQFHHLVHSFRVGKKLLARKYDVVILTNSERYAHAAINMFPDNVIVIPWIRNDEQDAYAKALVNKDAWNVAVGVSPKVAERAASLAENRPTVFISNGIEPPASELWQKRLKYDLPLRLVFVGRIEEWQKGVFFLPEIIKGCLERDLKVVLHVIGDGTDLDALKEKTKNLGVEDAVSFLGALPHAEVFKEMLTSHVLLMPSFFEGLPAVPIEAQACGCVPIASRLEGITDIVVDNEETGFLVDIGDVKGFVNKIEQSQNYPDKWSEMSKAGHEKVIREYRIETMGKNFIKLISDALNGHYPLPYPRRKYLWVNPMAFTWREHVPRTIHRLGLGNLVRKLFAPRFN